MQRKAFTLIELLAVIVVIVVVALIGGFVIAKVMNKAKLDSLLDTAYAVRKTANYYITDNGFESGFKVLNLTPGAISNTDDLLEIKDDPWGGAYKAVHVAFIKEPGQEYEKRIFLSTSKGCYILENNAHELTVDKDCTGLGQYIVAYDPVAVVDPELPPSRSYEPLIADWRVVSKGDHYGAFYDIVSNQTVNVNRNTTKTVYDPTVNKIFDVPANQLAIRPYASTRPGALGHEMILEEARTNYVLNSSFETDTNADGRSDNLFISVPLQAGETYTLSNTSLHGTKSQKIVKTSPTNTIIYQNMSSVILPKAGETYTFSVWVKGENVSGSATGADFGIYIDATKVGGGYQNPSVVAAPVGTFDWKLLSRTYTFTSDIQNLVFYPIFRNKTGTVWFDSMQVEKGTGATSFIPTTTASVYRAGDKLNIPTTNWNPAEGSILAAYVAPELSTATYQVGWNETDATNKLMLYNLSGSQNWGTKINGSLYVPAVKNVTANALVIGTLTWKVGDKVKEYVGGFTPNLSSSNYPQTLLTNWPTTASIGYYNSGSGSLQPNKPMHRVAIFNKQLSDNQVKIVSDQLLGGTFE